MIEEGRYRKGPQTVPIKCHSERGTRLACGLGRVEKREESEFGISNLGFVYCDFFLGLQEMQKFTANNIEWEV